MFINLGDIQLSIQSLLGSGTLFYLQPRSRWTYIVDREIYYLVHIPQNGQGSRGRGGYAFYAVFMLFYAVLCYFMLFYGLLCSNLCSFKLLWSFMPIRCITFQTLLWSFMLKCMLRIYVHLYLYSKCMFIYDHNIFF